MLPLIILRPEPGASATAAAARALGLEVFCWPLSEIIPLAWQPPAPEDFDALLLGSANALRHGGAALAAYRGKPAYAVGEATADAARAHGLAVAGQGRGGLQSLLAQIDPGHSRLLRLAGHERVAITLPPGHRIETRVVYTARPVALPPQAAQILARPCTVLLHSGGTAMQFDRVCEALGADRSTIRLAAIGPRVALRAGKGWGALAHAPTPSDAALLALAEQMCQEVLPNPISDT